MACRVDTNHAGRPGRTYESRSLRGSHGPINVHGSDYYSREHLSIPAGQSAKSQGSRGTQIQLSQIEVLPPTVSTVWLRA